MARGQRGGEWVDRAARAARRFWTFLSEQKGEGGCVHKSQLVLHVYTMIPYKVPGPHPFLGCPARAPGNNHSLEVQTHLQDHPQEVPGPFGYMMYVYNVPYTPRVMYNYSISVFFYQSIPSIP